MRRKIVYFTSLMVFIALTLTFVLSLLVTRSNNNDITKEHLMRVANIYSSYYTGDNSIFSSTDRNVRISIVDATGKLIYDSSKIDTEKTTNHLDRDEIKDAMNGYDNVYIRYSSTLKQNMMYFAKKVKLSPTEYIFIRVATPTISITTYLIKSIPLTIFILIGVLAITSAFSVLMSKRVLAPYMSLIDNLKALKTGHQIKKISSSHYPEIVLAVENINDLAESLLNEIQNNARERYRLNYLINTISDGIVVVDQNNNISMINKTMNDIFNVHTNLENEPIDSLTYNEVLVNAIKNSLINKKDEIFELSHKNQIFNVTVKYNENGWGNAPVSVIVLYDITEIKNNEQIRSEFFANASHELKTPLTVIKGFNEIMSISNNDEKFKKPILQISKEVDRVLGLIEDMLKLSRLENLKDIEKTDVSIKSVIDDVIESLENIIKEKHVDITVAGDISVNASKNHIYELAKNLIENSIKYNKQNGKVNIKLSETEKYNIFEIQDTGIGINDEHKQRIFERFYRVDTSRSRQSGGTGLGLSIVKHICLIYNAEIKLDSEVNFGTKIKIKFPK